MTPVSAWQPPARGKSASDCLPAAPKEKSRSPPFPSALPPLNPDKGQGTTASKAAGHTADDESLLNGVLLILYFSINPLQKVVSEFDYS